MIFCGLPRLFLRSVNISKPLVHCGGPACSEISTRAAVVRRAHQRSRSSVVISRSLGLGLGPIGLLSPLCVQLNNAPAYPIITQHRCYTSKIKPRKKKPTRDLEPVVHSLDRFYGLDPSLPKLHLDEVEELKTADDNVKKMFSLEFASNAEIKQYKSYKLMQELKEKIGLESTASKNVLPLRIARLTMAVRNCGKHVIKNPKDKANKRKMLINIDRRRKYLKRLRGRNYGHFEKIEEELGIKWVPIPKYNKRKSKRQIEQEAIKDKAHWDRIAAKQEFERKRNEENMIEIVRLKKELGKELTEEEKHFDNK